MLHGFTPVPKPGPLGPTAESLARQASVASTAFFPPAAAHTLLKGSSLQATPLVMPISFIPVGMPGGQGGEGSSGMAMRGGKLRPGGGSLQLLPSGGSFSIPAYARPLTQLDFISTGKGGPIRTAASSQAPCHEGQRVLSCGKPSGSPDASAASHRVAPDSLLLLVGIHPTNPFSHSTPDVVQTTSKKTCSRSPGAAAAAAS